MSDANVTHCAEAHGISRGHLGVDWGGREYYARGDEVYRTDSHLNGFPIMPDGYRCGRWQGSVDWFERYFVVRAGRVDR